jgi:hypothetical protein
MRIESLEIKKIDADIDFHSTQLDMIGKIQDYLQFMEESTSESKSTFIFSRCASVLHKSGRTTEIQVHDSPLLLYSDRDNLIIFQY